MVTEQDKPKFTWIARDAYAPAHLSPREVTDEQIVRVVVQYIDSQPARLHEDFVVLAIEALRKTWPLTM